MGLNTSYFCANIWVKDEELVVGGEPVTFGAIGDDARNMPGSLLPLGPDKECCCRMPFMCVLKLI